MLFPFRIICAEEAKEFSGEASVSVLNKYITLSGSTCESDPVVQPSLMISHASGFYANIWNSTGFEGSQGDEIDYFLGWAGDVIGLSTDLSVGYFEYRQFFYGRSGNFFTVCGKIGKEFELGEFASAEPYVRIESDIAEKETDVGGGTLYTSGLKIKKTFKPLLLWVEPKVTYTDGIYDSESTVTFQAESGVDYNCWRELTLTPKAMVSIPSDDVGRKDEFVFGLTAAYAL